MSEKAEAPVEAIARGLARRMAQVRKAEKHLAAFAWREGATEAEGAGQEAEPDPGTAWVLRVLRTASEGDNHRMLRAIPRAGDGTVSALAMALGCGRTDAVDRVSGLAQAGLVGRDLETDRVGLTELGQGVLDLVDQVVGLLGTGRAAGEGR